ncbi:MAG: nitrate/nitrite transporter NrtS [Mariprofundaceae bacterium]|nr:nitrate/nitrite transporter NrtS [Mariprofundaceae bacterium]
MRTAIKIATRWEVIRTATKFALIVGPVLALINHGDAIFAGTMQMLDWLKVGLTMIVPYTVSTLSSISAYRSCKIKPPEIGAAQD